MVMITKKEEKEAILALKSIMAIQQVMNCKDANSIECIWRIRGILGNLEKELKKQ
jgi:hypothetical protein